MTESGNPRDDFEDEKTDPELLEEAKAFYKDDIDYESNVRENMEYDIRMANNENHWDDTIRKQRDREMRPSLSIPRFKQFTNQIKNEQRQNKASIKVSPRGAKSEDIQKKREEAAKNRQGLIRFIQYSSKATDAYQTAYDFAVDSGRGFFRIDTEYVGPDSFDQRIMINRIPDPLDVVMDRSRKEIDYSDCQHGFIVTKLKRETFKNDYPDALAVSWDVQSKQTTLWYTKDEIWVVEYFCIRAETKELLLLDDGETIYREDMKDFDDDEKAAIEVRIEDKRDVKLPYVMYYKLTSEEVLEKQRLPGTFIPIIPVIGTEKIVVGKLDIKGEIRDLRDSIKSYNYWTSLETELVSLAPKAPYIMAAGQAEGYEKYWATANTKSHSYLVYKNISSGGRLVPPPQRQQFAGVPQGIVQAKINVIEDQKAITGINDPSLGASDDRSGKAILALQKQGGTATYHYIDNMRIAISHAGVIINEWLPDIYSRERVEKILGEDGEESTINLNGQDENGDDVELGDGEFDVVVTMGPSYNTKRQEAAESMMQFIQAVPQFAPIISDLLAKNMDWPGADEIAQRLRKTVPPEILEESGGEEEMTAQIQQLVQQLEGSQDMIEQMQQFIQELEKKAEGNEIDSETKIEVAEIKRNADITVANIRSTSEENTNKVKYITELQKSFTNGFTKPESTR